MIRPVCTMLIRVTDLRRSIAFYSAVFGIEFQRNAPTTAMAHLGDLVVVLQAHVNPESTTAVTFAVDRLDATIAAVRAGGGDIKRGPYRVPAGDAVLAQDPDGLPIEFAVLSAEAENALET